MEFASSGSLCSLSVQILGLLQEQVSRCCLNDTMKIQSLVIVLLDLLQVEVNELDRSGHAIPQEFLQVAGRGSEDIYVCTIHLEFVMLMR